MNKGIYDIFNLLYLNVITLIVLFISLVLILHVHLFANVSYDCMFFITCIFAYKLVVLDVLLYTCIQFG